MSGMNVLKMMRPLTMMRNLQVSPQLHSQMSAVRMMSSQKELEYIKVDTTGAIIPTSISSTLLYISSRNWWPCRTGHPQPPQGSQRSLRWADERAHLRPERDGQWSQDRCHCCHWQWEGTKPANKCLRSKLSTMSASILEIFNLVSRGYVDKKFHGTKGRCWSGWWSNTCLFIAL